MQILKFIYFIIPFKLSIFRIIKLLIPFPYSIYRHLHFIGVFKIKISNNSNFLLKHYGSGYTMESDFFWKGFGGFEKISCLTWERLSLNSQTVIDIGANTGIYSLITSSCNPKAIVYAFEPSNRVFTKLNENNTLNNFSIKTINLAVAEESKTMTYYDNASENPYTGSLVNNTKQNQTNSIQVKTVSLNDFIEENKITRIDLMKIDVEEFEPEVLRGMKQFLPQFKPALLIELLNEKVAKEVEGILSGLNYHYYNIDESKGLIKTEKLEKGIFNNYLICTEEQFSKANLSNFLIS